MQRALKTFVFDNLPILIIFAISFQTRIQALPYPEELPYNYYYANGTLLWIISEDNPLFTIEGVLPAMNIVYKPHLNLSSYNIISLGAIANTSDPISENNNVYGDDVCKLLTASIRQRQESSIYYIVIKQILRFVSSDCTTPESTNPYLISNGFHNVMSYDRYDIPCNKSWFYHIWIKYTDENSVDRYPITAVYQIDMAPGYHCDPEIYAQYN